MIWDYYIPHKWIEPRTIWEDIYLYPNSPGENPTAIHLVVDAVHEESFREHGMERSELDELLSQGLQKRGHMIDGDTVTIYAPDFDLQTLLDSVRIWLASNDHPCSGFKEVDYKTMKCHSSSLYFTGGDTD